jgi:hypothetical protein
MYEQKFLVISTEIDDKNLTDFIIIYYFKDNLILYKFFTLYIISNIIMKF